MPNHVTNEVRIVCEDEKTYDEFKELVVGEKENQEFDFHKIVPQPDEINPDLPQNREDVGNGLSVSKTGWYDWRLSNWGTKWNAYKIDVDWDEKYKECIEINFQTAWSPPEPIYFKLKEIFGDRISVNWFCRDESDNFCGYVHNQQYIDG